MANNLFEDMLRAVDEHDSRGFQSALQRGFDVRTRVRSRNSRTNVPFIEVVAKTGFTHALKLLLLESYPCQITVDDAVSAFKSCLCSSTPKSIISVFVDSSLLGILPIVTIAEAFRYSMEYECHRLARRIIDAPGFDVGCRINLYGAYWERPLHAAIKHNNYEIAERLLQLGSEVDQPNCDGITALMIACGSVTLDTVRLLLAHGADPNSAEGIKTCHWPLDARHPLNKVALPEFPNFLTNQNRWKNADADKVVSLLICAGLRPSAGNWLQRTAVVVRMSRETGLVLRKLVFRLPTLTELAVVQGRQQIRKMMNGKSGPGFNQILNNLNLPYMMKQQLAIELIS